VSDLVRVCGEGLQDTRTGEIRWTRISTGDAVCGGSADIAAQVEPPDVGNGRFWAMLSLEDLAESQSVLPLSDVAAIAGTWPGDADDGFEEAVLRDRLSSIPGGDHQ
jgi:hypothetical protein